MSQSPFKFLDSYTKEDKDIFFGRESEVEDVYTKIFQSKILLVYGASGTGKSSLISCGLANKFEDADWLPVGVRRGNNINESLHHQLEKNLITPLSAKGKVTLTKLLKSVYLDNFKPVFLIFDQFEELFIFGDRNEWNDFINNVRQVLDSELQVRFVFSIRGEYLEYLTEFETVLPEIFGNRIRIEKMTRANAVQCITGPCQAFGIKVEDHFSENLLIKLSPNKTEIELTYLQVFLDRVYKKAQTQATGQIIFSNKLLDELGNVGDVLSQFLDEQIELIPDSEKALALLKAFVSTDATKKQITTQQAADFVKTIGQDLGEKQVDRLIQELVNRRILKDKDELGRYELRHDSIAAKIFEKITTYERDLIEVNQFINYAFVEHEKRAFLLNESDLAYIAPYETKLNFSGKLRDFIERSKVSVKKSKRGRKRIIAVALSFGMLTIFSLIALIYAFIQQAKANESAKLARDQQQEALTQKESAENQRRIAEAEKAEATRLAAFATEQSNLALVQKQEAERQRLLANALKVKAEAGEKNAMEEREQAEESRLQAEKFADIAMNRASDARKATDVANKFRMLTLSQSMGARSVSVQDQDLKGLLALQAYYFNYEYGGYLLESDIYNGIYSAYKKFNGDQRNRTTVHQGGVKGLAFIDKNILISAGSDGSIYKTDFSAYPIEKELVASPKNTFQCMTVNADKSLAAFGSDEGSIVVLDLLNMVIIKNVLKAHNSTIWAIEFDFDNNLYSADNDGLIMKWNNEMEGEKVFQASSAVHSISLGVLKNQKHLALTTASGQVSFINVSSGKNEIVGGITTKIVRDRPTTEINISDWYSSVTFASKAQDSEQNPITYVKFNKDASLLAFGRKSGTIYLVKFDEKGRVYTLDGHTSAVSSISFDDDDVFMLSTSYDATAMLWNVKAPNTRQLTFTDHSGWCLAGGFDGDGLEIFTGDATGNIRNFKLDVAAYTRGFCDKISRNFEKEEWDHLIGNDITFQKTCPNK